MKLRALENWLYARVRDARSVEATQRGARPWSASDLRDHRYCLLISYRRNGVGVSTPVWFGIDSDRLYIRSGADDGKVKRIRRDSRVLVAPCTARGKPVGDPMEGSARLLPADEEARAEAALRAHYGPGRRVYRLVRRRLDAAYIEVARRA